MIRTSTTNALPVAVAVAVAVRQVRRLRREPFGFGCMLDIAFAQQLLHVRIRIDIELG